MKPGCRGAGGFFDENETHYPAALFGRQHPPEQMSESDN
jgi:hypothetical protein